MVLPFKTMDYDNDRFDTLNDVLLNNLSINDLIKYDGNNFTNVAGVTITSDGKVGIGVSQPEEDLEVDGNIQLDTGGVQRGRVKFYDKLNDHDHAEVDGLGEGTNGGVLAFYTKIDGSSVTEKLRINNAGAIGIGGANYGNSGQVIVSNGSGNPVSWVDQTDTTYTAGTGVTINGSNQISIGQSVGTSDNPSFNQLSLGVAGTNQGIINLKDLTNVGTDTIAQIQGITEGTNGGEIKMFTKVDGGSLTEKIRINNDGAIGIGGSNYGNSGQVIVSNGSGNPVSWVDQTDTTYTAGTGVTINGSNQISIGQSVGVSNNVVFNQVQAPTVVYTTKFSTDYKTIERCGSISLASGQYTTIATFLSNAVNTNGRSAELIFEEAHSPNNGAGKGGGLWVGNFTYNFTGSGTRVVTPQAFVLAGGHGSGILIEFDPIINTGAPSGAKLHIYNSQTQPNNMRYKLRFHGLDVFSIT